MFGLLLAATTTALPAITLENLPTEQVEYIARTVVTQIAANVAQPIPRVAVVSRSELTPLGAIAKPGHPCILVINSNPKAWEQWNRFFIDPISHTPSYRDAILATAIAHEMGHCLTENQEFAMPHPQEVQQLHALDGGSTNESNNSEHQQYKQELFADTVALLYAQTWLPQQAQWLTQNLIRVRKQAMPNDPIHNTAPMLETLPINTPNNQQPTTNISVQSPTSLGIWALKLLKLRPQ